MRSQSRSAHVFTEYRPTEPDLDTRLREAFVTCADALPGGRKMLGLHAHRVAKAAAGTYTPRPSDLALVVAAGGNSALLALVLTDIADALMAADGGDPALTFASVARETGEAVAAAAEHTLNPTPASARLALKEVSEGIVVLTRYGRAVGAQRRQNAGRQTRLGRVEVMS